ncbi:hypothetical protein Lal_00003507 [Lupinus albus]|uniref:DUF4228 domain-containing protein n=1 Tax=Lupinus albus TaxID=3870 RepID=A0A6A5M6E8_LUPAL|nr:hypothetical protein Lalb_Chr08g0231751 [Lupinus albus]KAE9608093.1 hypothetical protein Lalb_Chr08g0231861 [Lupinus albus]KAF1870301.1 hypothetical protein Lal_00003507 [Lupinus albus]
MGGCISSRSYSTSNNIRLVHLSGYVEDFDQPISVNQVTGNSSKYIVCTSIQLLSYSSSSQSLKGDTKLQLGNVYFILPCSILQVDVSPMDLASLAKRLTTIAKTRCGSKKCLKDSSFMVSRQSECINSSPCRSEGRLRVVGMQSDVTYGGRNSLRMQPWKPLLDTIRERSFNRRSESNLHENH